MGEFKGYFDKYSLLHVKEGEYSENGILFLAEFALLRNLILGKKELRIRWVQAILATTHKGFFDPNPSHENKEDVHFSHDNMTALYCLSSLMDSPTEFLPTCYWNKSINLHPRDLIFYTIMKNKFLGGLLLPLLIPFMYVSCITKRYRTSGKCLWFLRLHTLHLRYDNFITRKMISLMNHLVEDFHGERPFEDIFSVYFKDKIHPNNLLMEQYYDSIRNS